MQQSKQIIQLSDHVKNKIEAQQISPLSFSSDEFNLSEDDSLVSRSSPKSFRRRSSTFVTYRVQQPSDSESFFTDKQTQLCQECLRRENLLRDENRQLVRIHQENRNLSEQLRSSMLLNQQYQEEIYKLKQHLTKLNIDRQERQMDFYLLKQKLISGKNIRPKQDYEEDQIKRLRHELQVYNQFIAAKRKEEQKHVDYFAQFRKK